MDLSALIDQPLVDGLDLPLPTGIDLVIDGGHSMFVRAIASTTSDSSTPILALHGLTASSAINWVHAFGPLSRLGPVLAPDLRGHARGLHASRGFALEANVDDLASMLEHLSTKAIVVGFSMGGAIAQSLAARRPDLVAGLVLASTAMRFRMTAIGKRTYGANALLSRAARLLPPGPRDNLARRVIRSDDPAVRAMILDESARHSPVQLVRVAQALSSFRSRDWIGSIEVPTHVVVASQDRSLSPQLQRALAAAIPGATVTEVPTGHAGVLWEPLIGVGALVDAVGSVMARSGQPDRVIESGNGLGASSAARTGPILGTGVEDDDTDHLGQPSRQP